MIEQRTQEWFEQRKGRVTGSAVGAILGFSPFATPADAMRRMVREALGAKSEFKGNIATEYGTKSEHNAIQDYMLETGNEVIECGFYTHAEWLGASPDGLIGEDGLIEVKCPFKFRADNNPAFISIKEQLHYHAQIQIQLFVTGRLWCDFYQWSPFGSLTERVNYDSLWIAENLCRLEVFYDDYLEQCNPENAWRYTDGGNLERVYKLALASLGVAKSEVEDAKQSLVDATGGESGQVGALKITKVSKQGAISYAKAIKDIAPDSDLELYRGKESTYWKIS